MSRTWALGWVAAPLLGAVACSASAPDEEFEVVHETVAVDPRPLDPTAGFVQVHGVVEQAVVSVRDEPPPRPPQSIAAWHAGDAMTLASEACMAVDDGARVALLSDPRASYLLEMLSHCTEPAWCRAGLAALWAPEVERPGALARGLASCPSARLDAHLAANQPGLEHSVMRLERFPSARIGAPAAAIQAFIRQRMRRSEGQELPWLADQLIAGGHGDAARDALITLWRRSDGSYSGDPIAKALGRFDHDLAQTIHRSTCEDWSNREDPDCAGIRARALGPTDDLAERLRVAAIEPGFALRVARFEREWRRRGDDLVDGLFACAVARPQEPMTLGDELATEACLVRLAERDPSRAREAARALPVPDTPGLVRLRAALRHPSAAELTEQLARLELLPSGDDGAPEHTLVVDRLRAHGTAIDPHTSTVQSPDHAAVLGALLGFGGARVVDVRGAPREAGPADERDLVRLSVWFDAKRIDATVRPYRSMAGLEPLDVPGLVALANAVLARQSSPDRLLYDAYTGLVVRGTPEALAWLVEDGHASTGQLTARSARARASAELVDAGW